MSGKTVWRKAGRLLSLDALTTVLCLSMLLLLVNILSLSQPVGLWVIAFLLVGATGLCVQSVLDDLRRPDDPSAPSLRN